MNFQMSWKSFSWNTTTENIFHQFVILFFSFYKKNAFIQQDCEGQVTSVGEEVKGGWKDFDVFISEEKEKT